MTPEPFGPLRGAIEASGDVEVKNLGDGLMAMSTSPSRALAGGVGMQQSIERHNRHAETARSVCVSGCLPADLYAATGPIYDGSHERPVGRLANFLGRPAETEYRLRHALDLHRQLRANYWTATTMVDLVEVPLGPEMALLDAAGRAEAAQLIDQTTALASAGSYSSGIRRAAALAAIVG